MTDSLPGWYVDPSGLPDTFRWWDGRRWTQALTTDPTAPAPIDPEPVVPPGEQPTAQARPAEGPPYAQPPYPSQPYGHQPPPTAPVPPPPGAPGPDYVPPFDPIGGRTEVLASGSDGPVPDNAKRRNRNVLIGAVGGAVLLVLILIGGYLTFFSDDTEPAASEPQPTTPPPTRTPNPPPTPPQTPPPNPNDTPPPDPQETRRLEYRPLPRPWSVNQDVTNATFGDMTGAFGQARTTEPNYRDDTDWVAMVGAGPAREEWLASDLEGTADQAAQWFADNSFGAANVEREPPEVEPLEVSGQEGVLLKEHVSYDIPNLESTGETVYVAVVDLGEGSPPGVFVASVPDTHEQLLDDVDQAVDSLEVTG